MKFEDKREVYSDIATLYYLGDMDQAEIANIYGVSRFKISRVLNKCRTQKIVTFHINALETRRDSLSAKLAELLEVSKVIIVPSGSTAEESKNTVGQMISKYLCQVMRDKMFIGVSWGSTIQTLARYFLPNRSFDSVTFVQLSGNICSQSVLNQGYIDGSQIIRTIASKAEANWSLFQVPYIVNQPLLKELLLQESVISNHVSLYDKLDIACIGLGSSLPERSVSYLSGYITLKESKQLVDNGYGADICGTRLAADGSIPHTILDNRILSIEAETLRKVPLKIAAAVGSDKVCSLIAGARGKYIDVMIIDEVAALSMLNCLECGDY